MKKELINDLHRIGAVKFGEFTLKSGMISPIYIDLRILISHPEVLEKVADLISEVLDNLEFDLIAGIPYTALPIASIISIKKKIPMIYPRKEVKDYGTKRKIEGVYQKGHKCVVIDDLITDGGSKFEAVAPLEDEEIVVKDFIVLVDREQGGKKLLEEKGYNLHSIIKITELLLTLLESGKISEDTYNKTLDFIEENQVA